MSAVKKTISTTTSVKQSSSSSTHVMKTTSTSTHVKSSTSTHKKILTSSGGENIDINDEIEKMKQKMAIEMSKMRDEMQQLMPLERSGGTGQLVKIDNSTLDKFLDQDKNKFQFNFDVQDFASETVSVKAEGNKIEVHAQKRVKKGEDETTEEYSRTYEMPEGVKSLEGDKILNTVGKDGILTVELPFAAVNRN